MSSYVTRKTPGDTAWFTRPVRYVHPLGLYAMPARHEWVKMRRIPEAHYDIYFKHFNPDLYDARSGTPGQGRGHALCRDDRQASRGLLVRQPVHRLQCIKHACRT